ncbi:hypothetical protein BKA70DRAFT_1291564, partial [Coprinopsis sp. MPI-PUGE-AT-0042]
MPLDLLFKILTQDNGRALAAYCRPLLFYSVTLYALNPPILQPSWQGLTTRPEQFSCLVRVYPLSASLVKELRIVVIKPFPTRQEKVLKKIGIDTQRSEMKPWRSLLDKSYPSLTKLRAIISWSYRMTTLETLELEGNGLPPTLRHFSILGDHFLSGHQSQWNPPPNPVPTLDYLTLSTYLDLTWLSLILFSESPPFHLKSLTHFQTRPFRMTPEISRLCCIPSDTLRCLHIYLDYIFDEDLLDIAELRALTHLEVIVDRAWREFSDLQFLAWLERSIQALGAISSPGTVTRLSTLTICFLIHLEVKTQQEWDILTLELRYIKLTNIVAFATAIRRSYFAEVGTPQPFPTREGAPSCGCTGWRY